MYADKKCPICGKKFRPKTANAKYCSTECAVKGNYIKRKEWEKNSGYNERKRQQMRDYRAGIYEAERVEREAERKKTEEDRKQKETELRKKAEAELKKKAKAGDPSARMQLYDQYTTDYWDAYRDYQYQWAEQFDFAPVGEVSGIPLYDPDFSEKVVQLLEAMPDSHLYIYNQYVGKDTEA